MSETVPSGIDTLSPEDIALRDSMRDESPEPEAAPEPAPAPEPAEEIDLDAPEHEPAADGRTRTVPHQQFHAANERRKAAEAKAAAAEQKLAVETARVNERINLLMQAATAATAPAAPAAPPPVEIPDVSVDPVGHFKALHEQTQRTVQEQAAILRGFQEQQQKAQAVQELRNWGQVQEAAFAAQEPSYNDAMTYLREGRHAELEAAGVADPTERNHIIMGDITAIAMRSRQEGKNFAERLFTIATKRGFAPKAAPPPTPAIPALDADTALPDAAARVERGRANSTTLGSAGSAPPPALSPERIANLSDREFDALMTKMRSGNPAAIRDLMGH